MHILHPNVSECFLWISNYSFLPGKAIFDQGCSGWLVVGGWWLDPVFKNWLDPDLV